MDRLVQIDDGVSLDTEQDHFRCRGRDGPLPRQFVELCRGVDLKDDDRKGFGGFRIVGIQDGYEDMQSDFVRGESLEVVEDDRAGSERFGKPLRLEVRGLRQMGRHGYKMSAPLCHDVDR